MTYQDQRNEDHPEAVRSDPVPVRRSAPDDELDARDTDGDRVEADAGYHDNSEPESGYHDSAEPVPGQDADGIEDADADATGTVEEKNVYQETEQDRTGYDEPVLATPVDTDADHVDKDRADQDRVDEAGRVDEDRADDVPVEEDLAVAEGDQAADEHTELMPGEVDAEPVTTLIAVEAAQAFRDRWREVQLRFVDNPRGAAGEARGLAEEAADALVEEVAAMRTDLGGWAATEGADTEQLRVVVRRYRDFLDRMLRS